MNTRYFRLPHPVVQAIGLVTCPVDDLPPAMITIAARPIAAAVLRLEQDANGTCSIGVRKAGALAALEEPLPCLLDRLIDRHAITVIADADLDLLGIEAAARRTFNEPNLAAMLDGRIDTVDPAVLASGASGASERLLCRRLRLPMLVDLSARPGRTWREGGLERIDRHALAAAVTRLMLWANVAASRTAEPGLFFEPMLALHSWLTSGDTAARPLAVFVRSRPMRRAVACELDYRAALALRDPQ